MFRLVILLVCLVWASLMLISWSGVTPPMESSEVEMSTPTRS